MLASIGTLSFTELLTNLGGPDAAVAVAAPLPLQQQQQQQPTDIHGDTPAAPPTAAAGAAGAAAAAAAGADGVSPTASDGRGGVVSPASRGAVGYRSVKAETLETSPCGEVLFLSPGESVMLVATLDTCRTRKTACVLVSSLSLFGLLPCALLCVVYVSLCVYVLCALSST